MTYGSNEGLNENWCRAMRERFGDSRIITKIIHAPYYSPHGPARYKRIIEFE